MKQYVAYMYVESLGMWQGGKQTDTGVLFTGDSGIPGSLTVNEVTLRND